MTEYPDPIPVNIVTGFLGSGKTSIIQRLLSSERLEETAVLVNEFGEVGLDHHLFLGLTEATILMENGCVCCAIRGDMKDALRDLFSQMTRGEIPQFRRVIVETSGLADPVPIAYTVQSEPVIRHHFRLGNIVTAIDCVNGPEQLGHYGEAVKQLAVADRIILTKTDIADDQQDAAARSAIRRINSVAPIITGATDSLEPDGLFSAESTGQGLAQNAAEHLFSTDGASALDHSHTDGVHAFTIEYDRPLDWTAFGLWLTMLLHCHGDRILRIKGLLNVEGLPTPVLVNGVQHVVHAPDHLVAWPSADRSSRLVFIVDGLERSRIERSLAAFNGLSNTVAA